MAKNATSTTAAPSTETALATAPTSALAIDPLAEILGDAVVTETGTEELADSARIPRLAFNLTTITGADGKPIEVRKTVFVQTVTGQVRERVRLQVVVDHKSRQWKEQVDGKGVVRCSSWDGVTGSYGEERTERQCRNCPDYRWSKDEKGKNRRKCGDVHNVVAIDLDTADVVIVAVKKTAIRPWTDYYSKHFHRQRPVRDPKTGLLKKVDLPFFARSTVVELKLVTRNTESWAEPVFTPGPLLPREHILQGAQANRDWHETQAAIAARGDVIDAQTIEGDGGDGGGKSDTSFDFGENVANDGMR